jgi:protease-4
MLARLAHNILYSVWMIEPNYVHSNLQLIDQLLSGKDISSMVSSFKRPESSVMMGANESFNVRNVGAGNFKKDTVAVLSLHNPVMKHDANCGPEGTMTQMSWLRNAISDENVLAIVLDMDCPGGEATNIETFAQLIASSNKPILTTFNGLNASAAFWLSCASDEVYAQEGTDIIGSCGVMMSFLDVIPALEAKGNKYHEVYADQSKLKNKIFGEARKGNYEPMKKQLLNPFAEKFINGVKAMRPGMTDERIFQGETFMAKDAISLGMLDGIMAYDDVILRAYELGKQNQTQSRTNSKNSTSMKHTKICSTIDADALVVDKEKGSYLQEAQLDAVETALEAGASAEALVTSLTDEKATLETKVADLTTSIQTKDARITQLEAENKTLGGKTTPPKAVDGKQEFEEDRELTMDDAEHPVNKAMEQKYGFNPVK